jgi:hypothetical protein
MIKKYNHIKFNLHIIIFILAFTGCKESKKSENVIDSNNDWPFEDIADNFRSISEITISHQLSLNCNGEYLPVRKRILNKSEIAMSNSGSEQAKAFNDSIILAYIYNDSPLELIDEGPEYYKIRFDFKNQTLEGYILKTYCGNPTIKPYKNLSHSLNSSNLIINPELLPYCRIFVTEKFHNLLIQGRKSENHLRHLKEVFSKTETEQIIYSLFVGQSQRVLYNNKNRMGSDASHLIYCIKKDYFTYDFSNYYNMFVATNPSLPVKINSYSIKNDTLNLTTENYDNNHSKQNIKLFPLDYKKAFTSRKGAVWILNDTIRLKDISYISDKFSIPETQIGHTYFYEILELYIQDILPKRKDTYLEYYLKD